MLNVTRPAASAEQSIDQMRDNLAQLILAFIVMTGIWLAVAQIPLAGIFASIGTTVNLVVPIIAGILLLLLSSKRFDHLHRFIRPVPVIWLTVLTFTISNDDITLFATVTLAAVTAALITRRPVYLAINTLIIVRLLIHTYLILQAGAPTIGELQVAAGSAFVVGVVPLALGLLVRYVINQTVLTAENAQRTTNLLRASALIGQNISEMLDVSELLLRAVEVIKDRFGYYHVQIFIVDENQRYAVLTASTGQVGKQMLARQHRLPINADSIVGRAVLAVETIVTQDTRRDDQHSYNELLPQTRSEMALPLLDGNTVIGVLDLQSNQANIFSEMEIQALQVIASQLATAIRNARLFENQERNARENKRLFIESETNLREIQRLNRQMTREAWEDYLRADRRISGVTLSGQEFDNTAGWTDLMREAGRRRRPIIDDDDTGARRIAIPLELRGEVVGAIEIETNSRDTKDDIIDMVQAISQRLAVSLDNARLFEETNEATAREQRVSELVSQYQSADSVDDLLQITLRGLADTLGAEEGAIRLGSLESSALDVPIERGNGAAPAAPGKPQVDDGDNS